LAATMEVRWQLRGAWLLQTAVGSRHAQAGKAGYCGDKLVEDMSTCRVEAVHAVVLLVLLCTTIISVLCAFAFFREDKEEQIPPLCPQLLVNEPALRVRLETQDPGDEILVKDTTGRVRCKAVIDWPDPFRPGASGVAATVRLHNELGDLLATVVARNCAVPGQGLALCKNGCEIFGFVEPDPPLQPKRYFVRHRSGLHLLTLIGDFGALDIDAVNPAGAVVCSYKSVEGECAAKVCQHVDAGLMLCSFLSIKVHRQLTAASQVLPFGRPEMDHIAEVPRGLAVERDVAAADSQPAASSLGSPQGGEREHAHGDGAPPAEHAARQDDLAAPLLAAVETPAEAADLVVIADSTGAAAAPPRFEGRGSPEASPRADSAYGGGVSSAPACGPPEPQSPIESTPAINREGEEEPPTGGFTA